MRWLSRREVARCSREVEGPLCVRDEGDDGKGKEPQEALWCTGSSEWKMSVCGGGVNVLSGDEREG